jgi:hypothetical protein
MLKYCKYVLIPFLVISAQFFYVTATFANNPTNSGTDITGVVDFSDIKHSGQLAAASYLETSFLEKRLADENHTLFHHNELPGTALSYFLSQSATGVQYISFRGTSNVENAIVDVDLALAVDPLLNISLHQGFSSAARVAYNDLKPLLDKTKPVRTTGHSLGGAIAVIMAMYLQRDGYLLEQVVTFGQPKVTNVAGANQFSELPLTRVVTPKDIVPLVPPLSPLQLRDLDIYWHMGREVILLPENRYAVLRGLKSMMRATEFVSSVPDETNFQAHQMATYLSLIDDKLSDAKEMSYKVRMNLFGFTLK